MRRILAHKTLYSVLAERSGRQKARFSLNNRLNKRFVMLELELVLLKMLIDGKQVRAIYRFA